MSKKIERSALVNYTTAQMYDLVSDIEAYPEFMDGCSDARILGEESDSVIARLDITKGGLHQTFTTRNCLVRPHSIKMELVSGPFRVFRGLWQFDALDDESCKVSFTLEYEFSNFLIGLAAGPLINSMIEEQVTAVCRRAETVYGGK